MNAWTGFKNLWYAGNYWVRWAILILAFWPISIAVVALIGSQAVTATVALLPLLPIVFGLIAVFDPLVIAAVGNFTLGRKVLTVLATIIGAELAIGVFFSAVPVANDRGLIPLALLAMIAIVFFVLSGIKGKMISLLVTVLVGIAAISFMGGRDKVSSKIDALTSEDKVYTVTAERETKIPAGKVVASMVPDKPVFVRTPDGSTFLLLPDMTLCRVEGTGCDKVDVIAGKNGYTPAMLFVKAKEGKANVYITPS